MCPTVRPALGRFRAGVQEGPWHQGRQPAVRDEAPAVGASLDGPALLLHGRRSAPSSKPPAAFACDVARCRGIQGSRAWWHCDRLEPAPSEKGGSHFENKGRCRH